MSEFIDAIRAGDAARVESLLDGDPALIGETENGVTPLLLAVYHGKGDVARILAARAPLSFAEACALGDADRAEALLAADPSLLHSRTPDGFPAFAVAIFFGQGALARRLIERGADVNLVATNAMRVAPVHAAAAARDYETMRMLLERGADPNARQQMDYTPLHDTAGRGDIELAKLLVQHGADPAVANEDGMTALDIALKNRHAEYAEWIQAPGARQ